MATALKRVVKRTSVTASSADEIVLHEGWCVKESGTAFLGKTNWRRRWFRVVQKRDATFLQYFRGKHDVRPAGSVKLDITYCTRQVEDRDRSHTNVYAVGPLLDDGSTRTYYISCYSQQSMQEWMTVVDAAIQGVPEQASRRRETISCKYRNKKTADSPTSSSLREDEFVSSRQDIEALSLSSSISTTQLQPQEEAAVDPSEIHHEDISDDELLEDLEDEDSGGEEEEKETGEKVDTGVARHKRCEITSESHLRPEDRLRLYDSQAWRMEHWSELCRVVKTAKWKKVDTQNGVTLARCKFGRGSHGHAVIKIEGVLSADPPTVYQFLQLSTKEGGKLDYIFRNELQLDQIEGEPQATLIFNQFHPPLPRISKRDLVAMKLWVPGFITQSNKSGFVMFSVDHPDAPVPQKDSRRLHISPSGVVLSPYPGPDGAVHTHTVILIQVAFFGALHRMLKGAYNSGLLKLGLRSTFTHISEQLQRFVELVNM